MIGHRISIIPMLKFKIIKEVLSFIRCGSNPRHFSKESLLISKEVSKALSSNKPVVALESAVLTHGMPHPHNLSTALAMESLIRQEGAVPATTALLDGTLRVGVSRSQLERLCTPSSSLVKVSRRDLAPCVSAGLSGGTTVSGGMILAHWTGIKVFVTGGLGGVHERGEKSMDVSTDLTEMGRTPLAVVCAGVKSILDVERTLEVLETQGVTVCTLGADEIPGFFSPSSGVRTPLRVDSISDVTRMIYANHQLRMNSGVLICVPIPEAESVAKEEIDQLIQSGMKSAESRGVKGRDLTPFLLDHVREGTNGRSLQANISLLKNNATVGGQIASCLSHISRRGFHTCGREGARGRPVVVGAINLDLLLRVEREVVRHTTNAGWIRHSLGGVGRNLAQCLAQVGAGCEFVSVVGEDAFGDVALSQLAERGRVRRVQGARTAKYCSLLDQSGELMYGIADMEVHRFITPEVIDENSDLIASSPLVVFDGNLSHATISHLLRLCSAKRVPTWFEPTCPNSSAKFLPSPPSAPPTYPSFISPNTHELLAIHRAVTRSSGQIASLDSDSDSVARLCSDLLPFFPVILLTRGEEGALLAVRHQDMLRSTRLLAQLPHEFTPRREHFRSYEFPALPVSEIVSVSGAGDCLAGTVISGLAEGRSLEEAVSAGLKAASLSLQSADTVPPTLSPQVFIHTSTLKSQRS